MSAKTFNISMPEELVKKIDCQSKNIGSSRSDFIRQAVNKQLTAMAQWQSLSESVRKNYSGEKMSEEEVADLVRLDRSQASKRT